MRLEITAEAFPSGPPNIAAPVEGADTILDPRTGATGRSDNPALRLAWYLTALFGRKASWDDIDIPPARRGQHLRRADRHPGGGHRAALHGERSRLAR